MILLTALFVLALGTAAPLQAQDDLVRLPVPEVTGRPVSEAEALVQRSRVGPVALSDTVVQGVASGVVVRQEPAAGTRAVVPTTVRLWVNRTSSSISGVFRDVLRGRTLEMAVDPTRVQPRASDTLPDLRGRHLREGLKILELLKLPSVTTRVGSQAPSGTILRQSPAGGTAVQPGTVVDLVVSVDQATPVVPNVRGQSLQEAVRALSTVGLQVARLDSVSVPTDGSLAPGTVARQYPGAGSSVDPTVTAALWIARGIARPPEDDRAEFATPSLVGRTLDEARTLLEVARLALGPVARVDASDPAGTVVEQKPVAGELVDPGTPVAVAVSRGLRLVVPDVVGFPLPEAEATLAAVGLQAASLAPTPSTQPRGTVLGQSPAAGSRVDEGSPVDLTVAAAIPEPERVAVPTLVGLALEEAEGRLLGVELMPGIVELVPAQASAGMVVGQWPSPGIELAVGGSVRLDVASGVSDDEPERVAVPDVVEMSGEDALAMLQAAGLTEVEIRGEGLLVADQFPSPGTAVSPGTPILLTLQAQAVPTTWLPGRVLRGWRIWGLPVGLALLWALLRLRRVGAARGSSKDRSKPDDPEEPDDPPPAEELDLRPVRRPPRGSVEVEGPLLPDFALSLRARPPRSIRSRVDLGDAPDLLPPDRNDAS